MLDICVETHQHEIGPKLLLIIEKDEKELSTAENQLVALGDGDWINLS